jgi:hypothetical protein
MRKVLVGVFAAIIVIAGGGYFGWELLAQFRTKSEVEAVFASLRTSFPTATHGRIELAPIARSVRIADIVLQSADRATTVRIGEIAATGTRGPVAGRVSAARIEITDWEFTAAFPATGAQTITYKAPRIVVESFSGPAALPLKFNSASMVDLARVSLEYLAASSATTVTIPKLVVNVAPRRPEQTAGTALAAEYTYSDVVFRNIRDRRIAEIAIDRVTITSDQLTPELGSVAGAMAHISLLDFHLGNMAAVLDPAEAKADAYLPIYRRASTGPFEVRYAMGGGMQMDGMTVDGIALRPSKLSISNILALAENAPRPGAPADPAQQRALIEELASLYEGVRIGTFEMRGMKVRMAPDVDFNLAAIRLAGLENGRLAELAIEGLDGKSPKKEPMHVGRFALKGLHLANLVRQAARLADGGGIPPPDQVAGMLALLEGIELNELRIVPQNTQQTVRVDTLRLSWGQFVGSIPSSVRFTAKTTVPTDLADPGVGSMLSDAGHATITTGVDLGISWSEVTQTLSFSPATFEVDNAFAFSAELSLRNVPRSAFSGNPTSALAAFDQLEAGPLQISLRDTGALQTALAQYAKTKKLSVDDARKEIIGSVNELAKASAEKNPDIGPLVQALVQFIEVPGSTLTIRITPKEPVKFKQLIEKSDADPAGVSSLFSLEAKTTQ